MLRKYSAILFLIVAQIVILGHGIVSHHHHTDIVNDGHHKDNDNHHKNSKETPLEIAFSGFMHTGEHAAFTTADATKIVVSKDAEKSIKALPADFKAPVAYIVIYQRHTFPPDRHTVYQSPLYGAYSLRGPPFIIVA
ncbi:hypothetical protein ACR78F_07395 [Sphingobacterium spiritivorum]|uniref:Uncharacterized protein n=3 Tax=Sphingobacteriaceae TaxID=84566 RepID=A0A380CVG9_SPHSI|nr:MULTISPECIES: hypothetical protein [Sphingobacterium]EEI93597.1 hypothetical protein HMPREF0765_0749 [Sphingobacterium spiritivorum ATCC 33300]QQS95690.1 hypothetical protein I6J03_20315 [Sphingobacterium spiritivorum]QQT25641.1 hypothetical protein I6J02_18280 [Sphingobacterium spiritivorum]SUJ28697.1 Uncharacterised protein [Sphingobacterium spiritivorum]